MCPQWLRRQQRPNRHTVFNKASRRPLYYEDVYGKYNEDNDAEGGVELCESESESEGEVVDREKGRGAKEPFKQSPTSSKRKRTPSKTTQDKRPRTASPRNFGLFGVISPFKAHSDQEETPQFTMEGLGNLDDGFPVLGEDNSDQQLMGSYHDGKAPENFLAGIEKFAMHPFTKTVIQPVVGTSEKLGSRIYDLDDTDNNRAEGVDGQYSGVGANFQTHTLRKKAKGRAVIETMPIETLSSAQDLLTQIERAAVNKVAAETTGAQLAAVLDDILQACPACAQVQRDSVSIAQLHSHAQFQLLERLHHQHNLEEGEIEDFKKGSYEEDTSRVDNVPAKKSSRTSSRTRRLRERQQPCLLAARPTTRAGTKALLKGSSPERTKGLRSLSSRRRAGRRGGAVVVIHRE